MSSVERLRRIILPVLLVILATVILGPRDQLNPALQLIGYITATPTETPTLSPTPINTPSPTDALISPDAPTDTPSPTHTPIPTHTPTNTPSPTHTPIPTHTPTDTPSPTHTPVPTATPTDTPIPTSTPTPTPNPIVGAESAVLRVIPGDGYPAQATLPISTPLEIVAQLKDTDWLKVTVLASGVQGWLKRSDIAGNIDPNTPDDVLVPAPIPIAPLTENRAEVYQTHVYKFEWNWPNYTLAQFGDSAIFSFKISRTTDGVECYHTQTRDAFVEFLVNCGEAPGNYYWQVIVARRAEDGEGWEELSFPSVPQHFDYKLPEISNDGGGPGCPPFCN